MGGKNDLKDSRFIIEYRDEPEYKMITRSSDGQPMFLVNKLMKMKEKSKLGSRIAQVHNGSSLSLEMQGKVKVTFAGGLLRTTGLKLSLPYLRTFSITPAFQPISGF